MAEFNTRIRLKRDTSANWTNSNPVILDGEIIIVDTAVAFAGRLVMGQRPTHSSRLTMKTSTMHLQGNVTQAYLSIPLWRQAVGQMVSRR